MLEWLFPKRARRARLRETRLPDDVRSVLHRNVPQAAKLSAAKQVLLEGLVQVFVDEKRFEGMAGLEVTDEMRVSVAGQACILLLGLDVDVPYPGLSVIRMFPSSYRVQTSEFIAGMAVPSTSHRLGESSGRGMVALSWRDSKHGSKKAHDGKNVVLHEFAHQLDQASGRADGAPLLVPGLYGQWAEVLGSAFSELSEDVAKRRHAVIDAYGATNPAEFFAVATEEFFERPVRLYKKWPDVYEVLSAYYRQDPADLTTRSAG